MKYTNHAKEKMDEYGVTEKDVEDTIRAPEKLFLDVKTGRLIGVRKWTEDKHLVVVYEVNDFTTIVTVFPTSKINKVIESRVRRGRWVEL